MKRLSKLGDIIEKLKRGNNLQNRQLQPWFTEDEYEEFEQAWAYRDMYEGRKQRQQ